MVEIDATSQVAILLSTYNGQDYLAEQLDSYMEQTHRNWVVWASDDGSTDQTQVILRNFAARFPVGQVNVVEGPQSGFAANFLSLVSNPQITADVYAYSDQDDIWNSSKLEQAVAYLQSVPAEIPALYCSRTEYVDEHNTHIGLSQAYAKPPCFANALVQNIASGNTMVFNHTARSLLQQAGVNLNIPLHDWWTYMVVTGCDGQVYFDQTSSVRYRQHDNNLWGMNTGWRNRYVRIQKLFEGRFQTWNDQHLEGLKALSNRLTPGNRKILNQWILARESSLVPSLCHLKKSGVYRQTLLGNFGLAVAAVAGKI